MSPRHYIQPLSINEAPLQEYHIHPMSAFWLVLGDLIWALAYPWTGGDMVVEAWGAAISVSLPVLLWQKWRSRQRWRKAAGLAVLLGAVAAAPTFIIGATFGGILLVLSLFNWLNRSSGS